MLLLKMMNSYKLREEKNFGWKIQMFETILFIVLLLFFIQYPVEVLNTNFSLTVWWPI